MKVRESICMYSMMKHKMLASDLLSLNDKRNIENMKYDTHHQGKMSHFRHTPTVSKELI